MDSKVAARTLVSQKGKVGLHNALFSDDIEKFFLIELIIQNTYSKGYMCRLVGKSCSIYRLHWNPCI